MVSSEDEVHHNQTSDGNQYFLDRFSLFKTRSNFYLVGRDKTKSLWRVLKIDRSEPSKLSLFEDPTLYSWRECCHFLQGIKYGNVSSGGLVFVTVCYGIVGFIKFLGPYYMILVTEKEEVGDVCGHLIYSISKYMLILIPHESVLPKVSNHIEENRYKKLIDTIDFKDYYFSYTYDLMHSLQHNICGNEAKSTTPNESTFTWNAFLTQEIRERLGNNLWTVALIHGFFKQVMLSRFSYKFSLTLIARRSHLNAGKRFLKRGVNEKGEAANDVEIEQIVCGEISGGFPYKITSMVQKRGSVPLIWSQPTSWKSFKPDIILQNVGNGYEATRLHFEEIIKRYGSPVTILNLLKSCENRGESVLGDGFREVVDTIKASLEKPTQLEFISFDLDGYFKTEGTSVLDHLKKVTEEVLDRTGFFAYEVLPTSHLLHTLNTFNFGELDGELASLDTSIHSVKGIKNTEKNYKKNINLCSYHTDNKPEKIQTGVLRSNSVDCLDRTNVAQFVYGSVSLGYQLLSLGFIGVSEVTSFDESLLDITMDVYKEMGDTLSWQYGGSASRCKIFSEKKCERKPAIFLKEIMTPLQRYFGNVFLDINKQKAIDLFLGYLRPSTDEQEAPDILCQNLIPSLSESKCFICEGMSYKSLRNFEGEEAANIPTPMDSDEDIYHQPKPFNGCLHLGCCYCSTVQTSEDEEDENKVFIKPTPLHIGSDNNSVTRIHYTYSDDEKRRFTQPTPFDNSVIQTPYTFEDDIRRLAQPILPRRIGSESGTRTPYTIYNRYSENGYSSSALSGVEAAAISDSLKTQWFGAPREFFHRKTYGLLSCCCGLWNCITRTMVRRKFDQFY